MIELFERTLVKGGNLETARQTLLNQANENRLNRISEIEHDYKISMLIRECLVSEPKGSSGYAISKGVTNRLQQKYRDRESEKIVRKLNQIIKEETEEKVTNEEQQATVTGTDDETVVTTSN